VEIRELTVDDAETHRALRLRAVREEPDAFGSSWEEESQRPLEATIARLQDSNVVAFGGFDDDGNLVGMVRLAREVGIKGQHKANIFGMYVAPEARGRGLGRMLLDAAIARAREISGIELLLLAVVTTNTAARNLYLATGFEPYGREPQALKVGDRYLDEELMILFLE
jgi:ribosomal protein S18 acetylase RimI-like enzyme